jgi:hypothetical protein
MWMFVCVVARRYVHVCEHLQRYRVDKYVAVRVFGLRALYAYESFRLRALYAYRSESLCEFDL